jgi:hypothetical protein
LFFHPLDFLFHVEADEVEVPFALEAAVGGYADACGGWWREAGNAGDADAVGGFFDGVDVFEVGDDVGVEVEGAGDFVDELGCYCFGVDNASCVLWIRSVFTCLSTFV